jgi:hypothetical protein
VDPRTPAEFDCITISREHAQYNVFKKYEEVKHILLSWSRHGYA